MPDWMEGSDACFLPFPEHFNTVTGPASRTSMKMLPLREIKKKKKKKKLCSFCCSIKTAGKTTV